MAAAAAGFELLASGRERIRAAGEEQRAEVLRHMIRIAIDHAGRLPAEEMPLCVRPLALDAIQIRAPFRARFHGSATDRAQRDARSKSGMIDRPGSVWIRVS